MNSLLPVVYAKSSDESANLTRVSSLPLYKEQEQFEYVVNPPSAAENLVRNVRLQVTAARQATQPYVDGICETYQTGKSHVDRSLAFVRNKYNIFTRISIMAIGGSLGLLAARRGNVAKRCFYTGIGLTSSAIVCYPWETRYLAKTAACKTVRTAKVTYNFIIRARPAVPNADGQAFDRVVGIVTDAGTSGMQLLSGKVKTEEVIPGQADAVKVEEPLQDLGQGSPEDKDLYSTRG